jgi:hypothetical protein
MDQNHIINIILLEGLKSHKNIILLGGLSKHKIDNDYVKIH